MAKSHALSLRAFYNEILITRQYSDDIDKSRYYLDGYKADKVQISCTLYTTQDVDSLIHLLEIAKQALHTQGVNHSEK